MSNSRNWKDIAELIGIAAIVASLVFVGLQMRQAQEIAIVESRSQLTDRKIGLAELVKGSGSVWKRGLDSDELSDGENMEFLAIAEAVRTHYSTNFIRWNRIGPVDPQIAAKDYAYALYMHPGLRAIWNREDKSDHVRDSMLDVPSVPSPFDDSVSRYLEKLDSIESPLQAERLYVFW